MTDDKTTGVPGPARSPLEEAAGAALASAHAARASLKYLGMAARDAVVALTRAAKKKEDDGERS